MERRRLPRLPSRGRGNLSTSSYLQGQLSNVILNWEHPAFTRFAHALARFSRLIITDRRGLGCSERFTPRDIPPIETLVDDLRAVLDEAGSERPAIFATGDCGFIAMPFAATYPDRVASLILHETSPTWRKSDEIRWGKTDEELEEAVNSSCSLDGNWSQKTNPSLTSEADGLPGASGTSEYPSLGVAALRTGGGLTGRMFAGRSTRMRPFARLNGFSPPCARRRPTSTGCSRRSLHRHRRLDREGGRTGRRRLA
jgi:pimeloyl-ACP methyl ester carboxylesterase